MRHPNIVNAYLLRGVEKKQVTLPGHEHPIWVPVRALGMPTFRSRLRATWLVFTGRADALLWPGQGDK